MWTIPVPDLDRTDFLLMLGANPPESQGSLLAAPDVLGRLDAIRERGGKVVVVDPRRTGTADRADEWVGIRPGTDAALLFAMVNVLVRRGTRRPRATSAAWVDGVAEVGDAGADRSRPKPSPPVCGMDADDRSGGLARELAGAERAAVYGRIGTCNQEFGTLASWLVEVLNVLTGNLDRTGGSMFASRSPGR